MKEHCDLITADLEIAREELRESQAESQNFQKSLTQKAESLDQTQQQLRSFMERAELASGAESLVEKLTERNLKLEERAQKLTEVRLHVEGGDC